MSIIEFHYQHKTDIVKLALADLVTVNKIASNIRKAINKENANKCLFIKVYTTEE